MASTWSLVVLALACVALATGQRLKQRLSPAIRLDSELQPLLDGLYGYGPEPLALKRSPLQLKRHVSPSYDVEIDVGNLRNLLDVGKRQVSVASDLGGQAQMYSRLFDAGKRSLSPAHDLENSLALSDLLERAGRR